MNRKLRGDVVSFLIIIVMVLVVSVLAYFFGGFTKEVAHDITAEANDSLGYASAGYNSTVQAEDNSIPIADNLAFWFYMASILGFWISCAYVGFSPVTIGIYVIVIALGVFLGSQGADIRDDVRIDLADLHSGDFTLSNAVMGRYYPAILVVVGVVGMVIMYSKRSPGAFGPQ